MSNTDTMLALALAMTCGVVAALAGTLISIISSL